MRRANEEGFFRFRGQLAHPRIPKELRGDVHLAIDRVLVGAVDLGAEKIGPSAEFRVPDAPYGALGDALLAFYASWIAVNPSRMRVLHNPEDMSLRVLPSDVRALVGKTAAELVSLAASVGQEILGPENAPEVNEEMKEGLYWPAVALYAAWVHENPDALPVLHNPVGTLKRRLISVPRR